MDTSSKDAQASDSHNLRAAPGSVNKSRQAFSRDRRDGLIATIIIGTIALLASLWFDDTHGAELEPFAQFVGHTSDAFRGCPIHCGQSEPEQDFAGAGATITAGSNRRWEIDLAHGWKRIDRGDWQPGSQLNVRYYFLRNR